MGSFGWPTEEQVMKGPGSSPTSPSFSDPCYSFRKGKVAAPFLFAAASASAQGRRARCLSRQLWGNGIFKDVAEIRPGPGLGRWLRRSK